MNRILKVSIIIFCYLFCACQGTAQKDHTEFDEYAITLPDSVFTSTGIEQCSQFMLHPDSRILDVRTKKEFDAGHIENSLHIDVLQDSFADLVSKLDKEKTYIVYCRSGRRSLTAADIMEKQGFKRIINMEGGYNAWSKK